MTVKTGFFNSVDRDRLYSATDFSDLFEGLLEDGVLQSVGGGLLVSAVAGSMSVSIASGKAWFNNRWISNNTDLIMSLSASHPTLNRIDIVAIDVNKTEAVREVSFVIIQGIAASTPIAPTLISELDHYQYPLCEVYISAGDVETEQANMTNKIGTAPCPFASGILEHMDIDDLLVQWNALFTNWFNNLQDTLDENAETNLQNQIIELQKVPPRPNRNVLINGDMVISQRGTSQTGVSHSSLYAEAPDRWYFETTNNAVWHLLQKQTTEADGATRKWYGIECTTPDFAVPANSCTRLSQKIEGVKLVDLLKGSVDAKKLQLSFLVKSNRAGFRAIAELVDNQNMLHITKSFVIDQADTPIKVNIKIPEEFGYSIEPNEDTAFTLYFWLSAGSDFTTYDRHTSWAPLINGYRAKDVWNLAAAVNSYMYFTDVQLEVGEEATTFERLSPGENLRLCRRYYETLEKSVFAVGSGVSDVVAIPGLYLENKRVYPTLTLNNIYLYGVTVLETFPIVQGTDNKDEMPSIFITVDDDATPQNAYYGFINYEADSEL